MTTRARGVHRGCVSRDAVCRALSALALAAATRVSIALGRALRLRAILHKNIERPLIWIHAVSLGETRAAEPLIDALAARYPRHQFLLTHMTPTGRAAGADIAARLPGRVLQTYLPYDLPYAVRRFLRAFRPVLGISVETEAWPNLVAIATEQRVPMVLVNARLSERSYRLSRRYAALMRETAARFSLALAQTEADADRIRQVGARDVEVTGNMKFDFAPDEAQVARGKAWRRLLGEQPVWVFASTREGEEAMILDALPERLDARVVIVPRHPQRFDEVARPDRSARPASRAALQIKFRSGSQARRVPRRFDGRDDAVLRGGRRRVYRRQPARSRRTELDRGVRGGNAGSRRAAHV